MNILVKIMAKVYITQETTNADYTPAVKFGDIIFISGVHDRISPFTHSLNNSDILKRVQSICETFEPEDYLVCSGSPTMMAIVGNLLGDRLNNILVWDNREAVYHTLNVKKVLS